MPWVGDRQINEQTVEEAATTYVDLLGTVSNAWGRNIHPIYGDSSNVQYLMSAAFGAVEFNEAVDAEFSKRRISEKPSCELSTAPRM